MISRNTNLFNFLATAWVLIILLQVLRLNFNYFYLPILIIFILYNSFVIFKVGKIFLPFDFLSLNIWIFYALTFYVFGLTFFYGDINDFLKSFPRASLMPLSLIFFYNFLNLNKFDKILKIYLFVSLIGALSLVYQVFVEPLNFIVSGGGLREELPRYATTMGSLTVYGGTVGILLVLSSLLKMNFLFKLTLLIIFTISSFFCMSKAGIMNLFIFLFFYIFFFRMKYKFAIILSSILLFYILFFYVEEINDYVLASINSLSINENKPTGLEHQFIFRFFGFHSLEQHSFWNNIFGFGLIGGQGAFGLPTSIAGTTHNQFFDAIQIGGALLFLNILCIFVCLLCDLFKYYIKENDYLSKIFFYCTIIAIINMFFFNGFLYQPTTSFVIWLSVTYLLKKKFNEKNL